MNPPPKKRPKFLYSEQQMKLAIEAVNRGETPFSVSKRFNVPRSTLENKVKGKTPLKRKMGPPPVFGVEAEEMIVNWVKALAVRGFPVWKCDLLKSVGQIIKDLNIPNHFTNGIPGRKWLYLFLKRHPSISERTVEKLSSVRSNVTEANIRKWFLEVEEFLESEDCKAVLSQPSRLFNADESAFMLCPKSEKVLGIKGQKNVAEIVSGSEKESLTVLTNVSADGAVAPTLVIFPGQRLPQGLRVTVPEDWSLAKSDKGWMTAEVFYEYIVNIFYKWLLDNEIELPIILFLDGHTSHITYHLSKFCNEHKIIIVALCPNATHIVQPLDVAVFKPVKQNWARAVHDWRKSRNNTQQLTKFNFAPILKQVMDVTLKKETIENGFRKCGLSPWNPDAIDYTKTDVLHSETPDNKNKDSRKNLPVPVETQEYEKFVNVLESLINKDTLVQFKETYRKFTPVWMGETSSQDLYVVWKKAKDAAKPQTSGPLENTAKENVTSLARTFEIENIGQPLSPTREEEESIDDLGLDLNLPSRPKSAGGEFIEEQPTPTRDKSIEELQLNLPSTSAGGVLGEEYPSVTHGTNERQQKMLKVISPKTNGKGVPSPFKNHLFWPVTPEKKNKTRKTVRMPSVVSSKAWLQFEEKKIAEKEKAEKEKEERKKKREKAKEEKGKKGKGKKSAKEVYDVEEDWICKICGMRYSSEIIKSLRRRWVECDECKLQYHYKCIPKEHLHLYGLEEEDEDDDEVAFICHLCVEVKSDDDLADILGELSEESDT